MKTKATQKYLKSCLPAPRQSATSTVENYSFCHFGRKCKILKCRNNLPVCSGETAIGVQEIEKLQDFCN